MKAFHSTVLFIIESSLSKQETQCNILNKTKKLNSFWEVCIMPLISLKNALNPISSRSKFP